MKMNLAVHSLLILALGIATTMAAPGNQTMVGGWVDLFDGKTLEGWVQKNGTATYRVEAGTIIGKTAEGSPNSFLCTTTEYSDFELRFEVKVDSRLNSGVQLRSKTKEGAESEDKKAPEGKEEKAAKGKGKDTDKDKDKDTAKGKGKNDQPGRVYGPQVEIAVGGTNGGMSGYIYGEATGRGWLTPKDKLKPHNAFRDGDWNTFQVKVQGPRFQVWINGQPIEDLTDEEILKTHPKGFISLQVHGIKAGTGPYEVAWRNIRLRDLTAK